MDDPGRNSELRPPSPNDPLVQRTAVVERAATAWASQIIDLGGRDNLLFYRDLNVGTIDLTPSGRVDEAAVDRLLDSRPARLSRIVTRDDLHAFARLSRAVRRKADENNEERGLQTLFLTHGIATWTHTLGDPTPAAPVVLAPLRLTPRDGVAEDFDLELDGDWSINPTLVHLLQADFDVTLDAEELLTGAPAEMTTDETTTGALDTRAIHRRIVERCSAVPGFTIGPQVVVGNFFSATQPLVLDIEESVQAMIRHPIVSAIAGAEDARRALIDSQPISDISEPDHTPPADEFLILDADASQSDVVNAAVKGANLVVHGPPGTGKSQTIANLIAALAARGRSTLFVAEKRAALDVVTRRLAQSGLESLVLHLHDSAGSERAVLQQLARGLDAIGDIPAGDLRAEDDLLVQARDRLNSFEESLHRQRGEIGPSVYEMQSELLGIDGRLGSDLRLPRSVVEAISWDDLRIVEDEIAAWVDLDGASLGAGVHPWEVAVGRITHTEQAEHALQLVEDLASVTVPEAARHLGAVAAECALVRPDSIAAWEDMLSLVNSVDATLRTYDPGIFDADLEGLAVALAPARKGAVLRGASALFTHRFRRSRAEVWALTRRDRTPLELLTDVERARDQRAIWAERALDNGLPRVPDSLAAANAALESLNAQLVALEDFTGGDHRGRSLAAIRETVDAFVDDRTMLLGLPRLQEVRALVDGWSLAALLDEVSTRNLDADDAAALARSVWLRSMLDLVGLTDDEIGSFDGSSHTEIAVEFGGHDRDHIGNGGSRVLRRFADHAVATLDAHPEQALLLREQAGRQRGHLPLRDLLTMAPDVPIAIMPCWAMSPLLVSQLLPSDPPLFDVVIFDEASQIPTAHAVPAVLRGKQLIVAGDSRQLPPTTFFTSTEQDSDDPHEDDEDDEDDEAMTGDVESILDSMVTMLPPPHGSKTLAWHYRSSDERLIAFSNGQPSLYDRTLATFPGVAIDDAIRHVKVARTQVAPGRERPVSDEVLTVVDLVVAHARERPATTLGVIAMGIEHAADIAEAVRLERMTDEVLDAFLADHTGEPFFVKNAERVQGDERDDIILTIGYGMSADGHHRFGPLEQEGGERRLNVAITRARRRVTLVTSFGPEDLDDDRLPAEGAKMLGRYLTYAATGGADLGAVATAKPALDPFEADVLRHLIEAGMPVTPQLGGSEHPIDFAVAHPSDPGRYVLAIETDGPSYHSSATARDRDRLRQEHLERLGWRFHRIWSTEWFRHRDREIERALNAWRDAGGAAGGGASGAVGGAVGGEPRPLPRPVIRTGEPITAYSGGELDAIVAWIRSDRLLRTDDELLTETVRELGYRRKGSRIVAAVESAIDRTRPAADASALAPPSPAAVRSADTTPPPDRGSPPPLETGTPDNETSGTGTPDTSSLAPPTAPGTTAGWLPDPTGRFDHRYWDGTHWTEHASRAGEMITDQI